MLVEHQVSLALMKITPEMIKINLKEQQFEQFKVQN